MAGTRSAHRSFLPWFALAIAVGLWLRLDQFAAQLLLEDEWHAVYRVVHDSPAATFLDFAHSDSSIPLTLLYALESRLFGLSEIGMRLPLLFAAAATLIFFPWYVAGHVGRTEALVFAALLAISPLLYFFSRTARPYALTLLLAWIAHVAFRRYFTAEAPRTADAAGYAVSATLAAWLHPVVGPFVVAPFVTAAWQCARRGPGADRRCGIARLAVLALATAPPMAALLLPPLLAHPESLRLKSGVDLPHADTLIGVWYLWFGTGAPGAVLVCGALALFGIPPVWRRLPEARSAAAGIALCALALVITRPAWIHNPLTFGRYLLPVLPLLLLATACGAVGVGRALGAALRRRGSGATVAGAFGALAAGLPVLLLALTSPLRPLLQYPNANSLHAAYQFDFRPKHNPVLRLMDGIPLSPWWERLGDRPPGSLAIAVAPFPTESVGWDAPRWQRLSRQRILHGFLTPLCVNPRPTEVPDDERFRFRNAVHLGNASELARHRVDFVVWQKPYRYVAHGLDVAVGADVGHCAAALRARFGTPAYEDEWLVVYRPPALGGARDATE
ncbi:MAG: glycosyltransferase family 39 protein [Pseudomonadota bacterium]|nr:glycosyltransferase family 39 protein [Pseudomonadota bacterium]